MFCKNCGNEIFDDSKFCSNCGQSIAGKNDSFESDIEKEEDFINSKPKKIKGSTVVTIIIIVIAAAVIIGSIIYIVADKSTERPVVIATTSEIATEEETEIANFEEEEFTDEVFSEEMPDSLDNLAEEVYKENVKVYVDGKEVDISGQESVIHNDTVYLPIAKVGEFFGKSATWNKETSSVYFETQHDKETYIFDIMQPYASNGYSQFSEDDVFNFAGAERKNGFRLGTSNDNYVTFNMDGKYNALSFEAIGESDDSTIQIYADGNLIQKTKVPNNDTPKKINVSLKGVQQLKITASGLNIYGGSVDVGFWNITLY